MISVPTTSEKKSSLQNIVKMKFSDFFKFLIFLLRSDFPGLDKNTKNK